MQRTSETVKAAVAEGLSTRQIAARFGKSQSAMRVWMERRGIKTTKQRFNKRPVTGVLAEDVTVTNAVRGTTTSLADVLRALGLKAVPNNYKLLKNRVEELGLNTSHIQGKARRHYTDDEVFCVGTRASQKTVRGRFLKLSEVAYQCAVCEAPPVWQGEGLVLVMDHINGDNSDGRRSNLRWLCPNCNSQQVTFCRGNTKPYVTK